MFRSLIYPWFRRGGSCKRCPLDQTVDKLGLAVQKKFQIPHTRGYTLFRGFEDGALEPNCTYDGVKIYVASTLPELLISLKYLQASLKKHKLTHVGFDTEKETLSEDIPKKDSLYKQFETTKLPPKKLALVQFATKDVCILIRIPLVFKDIQDTTKLFVFPSELRAFLENEKILKVGVSASWDSHALKAEYKLLTRGVVNLDRIAKSLGHGTTSLKSLCIRYQVGINPLDLRHKQWFQKELSERSILYAAKDAIAGYRVYSSMKDQMDHKDLIFPSVRKRRRK
ncbi:hypothetical protein K7432_017937 [Basidiobolus ranarum]|uniref:3'-5' exonuclease n=1 Tax=Basidiobolus ranarum TaxID=34480 RepID=A0ABR2VJQ0_9FUNG